MYKSFSPDSWPWDEPGAYLVKAARAGLRGNDRAAFVKRAGAGWDDALAQVRPGETPVHLIAMGATEAFGPNRNGDGFLSHWLRRKHATFETKPVAGARFFRDHKNRDLRGAYGRVIKSAFNEEMQRVELLAALYATKEAAERYNGKVADLEHDKLERSADIPTSMSCKIAFDVCAGCKNEAPRRAYYCDDKPQVVGGRKIAACKRGGVKNRMTHVHEDGFINHVDNPDPDFFDISHITKNRQADRTAFVLGALRKAAGCDGEPVLSGVELAALYGMVDEPDDSSAPAWARRLAKRAAELAALEGSPVDPALLAGVPRLDPELLPADAKAARAVVEASPWCAMLLPPAAWLAAVGGDRVKAAAVAPLLSPYLAGVFGRLAATPDAAAEVATLVPEPKRASSTRVDGFLGRLVGGCGLDPYHVGRRASLSALRQDAPLASSVVVGEDPGLEKLALAYASYQLSVLDAVAATDPGRAPAAAILIAASNRVA